MKGIKRLKSDLLQLACSAYLRCSEPNMFLNSIDE